MTCQNQWVTCICYQDPDFLKIKMDELVKAYKIEFYTFIWHKKEGEDLKDHIHMLLKSNSKFDSMKFQAYTQQPDLEKGKPKKSIQFQAKKGNEQQVKELVDGILLYNKHDPEYLKKKGETRIYHYKWEDFIVSDEDEWEYMLSVLQMPETKYEEIEHIVEKGEHDVSLIRRGVFGYRDIGYITKIREAILQEKQMRHDHDRFICRDCGVLHSVDYLADGTDLEFNQGEKYATGICANCYIKKMKSKG